MRKSATTCDSNATSLLQNGGNTETPFCNNSQSRKWCITLNNYTDKEYATMLQYFIDRKYTYIIGKETAETGTKHLQVYIEHKSPIRFITLKKLNKRFHIEKSKGNKVDNFKYCSKENDFISNYNIETREEKILNKRYNNIKWKPWQNYILETIKDEPDTRRITYIYDPPGKKGKSFLCKYIALKYKDVIIADGKKDNIFNQINILLNIKKIEPRIILLDIPRYNQDYLNYGVIEQIKDGLIYSGKYEGGLCIFDHPHVFIFSNSECDMSNWSEDRYNIIEI